MFLVLIYLLISAAIQQIDKSIFIKLSLVMMLLCTIFTNSYFFASTYICFSKTSNTIIWPRENAIFIPIRASFKSFSFIFCLAFSNTHITHNQRKMMSKLGRKVLKMAGIDFSYPKTYISTSCTSQYVKNDNFSIFGDPGPNP